MSKNSKTNGYECQFYLVRGIPGAGKSTTAEILRRGLDVGAHDRYANHFEADMYFMRNGVYEFNRDKLGRAHEWCLEKTEESLKNGMHTIVSNTFTTIKELRPYFKLGAELGIKPSVLTCHGNYGSIHGVPDDALQKMRDRFVYNLDDLYNEYFS